MGLIDGWNIHGSYTSTGDYSSQPCYIQLCEGYTITDAGFEKKTASSLSMTRKENMNESSVRLKQRDNVIAVAE